MDDEVFRALAHPIRRRLLDLLFVRDGLPLGELEATVPEMTRFGVMKHLRVLEAAGLVSTRRVGRETHHYLNAVPIRQIHDRWLDRYRARAAAVLLDLKSTLEEGDMDESAPARVFMVLVESDWEPGSPYRYLIAGSDAIVGEVLESDSPRRLALTFDARWDEQVASDPPSRITWEIAEAGPGVVEVKAIHDGLVPGSATAHQVEGMAYILSGLKTLLETGEPLVAAQPATV